MPKLEIVCRQTLLLLLRSSLNGALKTVHVIIHLKSEKKHGVQYKLVYAGIHTLFSLTWLDPGASLRRQPT